MDLFEKKTLGILLPLLTDISRFFKFAYGKKPAMAYHPILT